MMCPVAPPSAQLGADPPFVPPPRLHSLPLRSASSPDQPVPLSGEPDPSWREKRSRRVLPSMRQVARKRAQQRWSALLTAKKSRLAREMKAALGERCWAEFLVYAARYKRSFLKSFDPPDGMLRCVGKYGGVPCPEHFAVDLGSCSAREALCRLELDHEHDVQVTCDLWRRQLPLSPTSWSDGVQDPQLLCHLLFGTEGSAVGPPSVRFRCAGCHDRCLPHYNSLRTSL